MLSAVDPYVDKLLKKEIARQKATISLIASENLASRAVRYVVGSEFTNKYAEGYPSHRYYGGCQVCDDVEEIAVKRAKEIFSADHVNVQPHSGSNANMAAFFTLANLNDTILAMDLDHGGHLTHGARVSFSGKWFNIATYGVSRDTYLIDYEEVEKKALELKPKIIIAGASAYSREIDFKRFADIANNCGAYLLVDMAHIAGLVAAGVHQSPVPHAHMITSTTHKSLRGARGGLVLCKKEFKNKLDKWVFPGLQGGPLMHEIAGKAVCFNEALHDNFKTYQQQVCKNAKRLAHSLIELGFSVVSGGTDNHLMLLDVSKQQITGVEAENKLAEIGVIVNKNKIPFDDKKASITSGIRLGTPSITTRGMAEEEMDEIAWVIHACLKDEAHTSDLKKRIEKLANRFIFE